MKHVVILNAMFSLILAGCAPATAAATPTLEPSATEVPSSTPTEISPALATLTAGLAAATAQDAGASLPPAPPPTTEPLAFDCVIRSQTIRNGTKFDPKERFDMAWQVENWSTIPWDPDEIRFTYYSGAKLQVNDTGRLREVVQPGKWSQVIVPMVAPRSSGGYTTTWALWYGDEPICRMNVTILVR